MNLGNKIRELRRARNLTQEQLAEKMNLSLQSISCIELGKKAIRPENLVKLCEVLDATADYILTGCRTERQLKGLFEKIATLNEEDYAIVEKLIDHLKKR